MTAETRKLTTQLEEAKREKEELAWVQDRRVQVPTLIRSKVDGFVPHT